jgi:4-alpha-glucanotransferase
MYAVTILESHRHQCELVGENLGTMPAYVNRHIQAHGIAGMWVAPYELEPGRRTVLAPPASNDVVMLNTHDMPPFVAWWTGGDIDDRLELGLIDAQGAAREREERFNAIRQLKDWLRSRGALTIEHQESDQQVPVQPMLRSILDSPARLLLVNLEDLWLETRPQNIPGTSNERPNWRRKSRYRFEEFSKMPQVLEVLSELTSLHNAKEQLV